MDRIHVFDKIRSKVHPYEEALREIFNEQEKPEDRAAARNLSHDHRVTRERQDELHKLVQAKIAMRQSGGGLGWQELADAAKQYFKERVRERTEPDFCMWESNNRNILKSPGKRRRPGAPAEDELLVNVFDLLGPKNVYITAAKHAEWKPTFEGLGDNLQSPEEWLDEKLGFDPNAAPGPLVATEEQRTFVKANGRI
jgi:hypothetical protein